jgi:hypothetical protein
MNKKILLVAFCLFTLMGCGKSVSGVWKGSLPSISGDPKTVTITLSGDRTFTYQIGGVEGGDSSGIYELKRNELRLTATKVAGMELPPADQTAQIATLSEDRKSFTLSGTTFTKQ